MTIKAGKNLPQGSFKTMTAEGVIDISVDEVFKDKRVALFAVPAVFTPGCSQIHLPSYLNAYDDIIEKGFDTIACIAVHDAWVMDAWAKATNAEDKILMLADGSANYVRSMGLDLDLNAYGMGIRCKRFSMVVVDGRVESLNIDERVIDTTSAAYTCGLN